MENPTDITKSSTWAFPMLLLCATLGWCYFETLAFMDTRGGAVGFHPNVIGAIPFAFLVSLALILFACFKKSLAVAACSILPIILLGLPIYYSYQISIYGWSNEIHARSDVNAMAIDNTDFSTAHFDYVPYKDHERMTEVVGFQWSNTDERTGAKNGVFFGLRRKFRSPCIHLPFNEWGSWCRLGNCPC